MVGSEPLRWLLTAAFVTASALHVLGIWARAGVPRAAVARVSDTLHVIMGGSMIVMIWPWGDAVPPIGWAVAFTVAGAWFVRCAMRATRRTAPLCFAAMTGAMAWMGATGHTHPAAPHAHMPTAAGPQAATTVDAIVGGLLVLLASYWFARGMRGRAWALTGLASPIRPSASAPTATGSPHLWQAWSHGIMSAGMGIAMLAMV